MPPRVDIESLGALTVLGGGGQGTVYAVADRLIDQHPAAYKEFGSAARAALDEAALTAMVDLLTDLPAPTADRIRAVAAWPSAIVDRDGTVCGFLMRRAPEEYETEIRLPRGPERVLARAQLLLNDARYLAARGLAIDDRFRLELLHDTAQAIELCHGLDIVVGDLSPNNLLFTRTRRPRCFFLDCDAMRLRGASVLRQAETTDWEAPAGDAQVATPATDVYKFALLCVRLFAGDQSARDPVFVGRVSLALRVLADRSLAADPGRRPGMAEWRQALAAALAGYRPRPVPPAPSQQRSARADTDTGARWRWSVAAGIVALLLCVVATLGAGSAWLRDAIGSFGGDRAGAAEQANGVALVLTDATTDRARVAAAVRNVETCADVHTAGSELRAAVGRRGALLERTAALHTDRLPGGADLKAQLLVVFGHAHEAAEAYRAWAAAVERAECRPPAARDANRRRGDAESRAADPARRRVVELWNPMAHTYGHPPVSDQDF